MAPAAPAELEQRARALLEMLAVPELVEPYPSEAAARRGSTGTAAVPGMVAARAAQEVVEIGQVETVPGMVAARAAPVVAALLQLVAAARPGRMAAPLADPAVRGRAAMVLVAVAVVQEKAAPRVGPAAEAGARALAAAYLAGAATAPVVAAALGTAGTIVAGAVARPDRIVAP